nr:hypothetical protein HUO10_002199 [Paraburkholderia busanensis]
MRTMRSAVQLKSWGQAVAAAMLMSVLVACGGGGGGGGDGGNSGNSALNGGSLPASPTQQPIAVGAANTAQITVGAGTNGVANIPTVSVTICAPGSATNCQTIPNIQVDTASFGLRLVSSVINPSLLGVLPVSSVAAGQLAECATFADGYTWGSVRTATVSIGGETTTSAIPLQIIGDMAASTVPSRGCSGSAENTVSDLGANGILGIGTALNDCGTTCSTGSTAAIYSNYYACPGGASCSRATVPLNQQVANPVANFAGDNNGVIVQLPPVGNTGNASVTGTLVFGINTQTNNPLAASQSFTTDGYGDLNSSVFNGSTVQAFLDSGSNAYFFADSSITQCGGNLQGFYCPSAAQTRSVTLGGNNSTRALASIGILNASTLFNTSNYAFNDLAGQLSGNSSFDLGLPFFYGRYVYYGFDRSATGGQTPFVAF